MARRFLCQPSLNIVKSLRLQTDLNAINSSCAAYSNQTGERNAAKENLESGSSRRRYGRDTRQGESEDLRSIEPQPMIYSFTGMPPDESASRISDASKEKIWKVHKEEPVLWTVERLAKEYRVRRQRIHAILWLKDIEKKMEAEQGKKLDDDNVKAIEQMFGVVSKGSGEKHWSMSRASDPLLSTEENMKRWEEQSAKEEELKVREFEMRMNFNKKQLEGQIIVKKENRRRPSEGWSYVVEELGEEGKRGKGGGRRYVASADGTRRGINDLEKDFLQREAAIPRRRIVPR